MKNLVLFAGCALLAACGEREEAAPPEAAATEAMPAEAAASPAVEPVTPGSYDVTRPDGTKLVATINADGTYQRDYGDRVEKGKWTDKDGKTCFVIDGETTETCYARSPRAADGTFTSTDPQGGVSQVVPRP